MPSPRSRAEEELFQLRSLAPSAPRTPALDALILRPRVGVGAVLVAPGERILVGERAGSHGAGRWALPGGHLERGESFEACGAREAGEETGLELAPTRFSLLLATNDVMEGDGGHYVTLFVGARVSADEARLVRNTEPDKCRGWEWLEWKELAEKPTFLPLRHFLESGGPVAAAGLGAGSEVARRQETASDVKGTLVCKGEEEEGRQRTRWTLLYYCYVPVGDRAILSRFFEENAARLALVGRVRVAKDGVNATLGALSRDALEEHCASVRSLGGAFKAIDFKVAPSLGARSAAAVAGCRFDAFEAKIVDEVVTMNVPPGIADPTRCGRHLSPLEFHRALLDSSGSDKGDKGIVLIDVRNGYESEIGRFVPPAHVQFLQPNVRTFAEFPAYFDARAEELKDKTVLMYCTGGVRCERASAYLRERGVENVSQLSGGIQRYLEAAEAGVLSSDTVPPSSPSLSSSDSSAFTSMFAGRLFVFDERRPVRVAGSAPPLPSYRPSDRVLGSCVLCAGPHDEYAWLRCGACSVLVLVCDACVDAGCTASDNDVRSLRCANCAGGNEPRRRRAIAAVESLAPEARAERARLRREARSARGIARRAEAEGSADVGRLRAERAAKEALARAALAVAPLLPETA